MEPLQLKIDTPVDLTQTESYKKALAEFRKYSRMKDFQPVFFGVNTERLTFFCSTFWQRATVESYPNLKIIDNP